MEKILILHGWGSCAKNWEQVKELLEKKEYKVFIPDLPGFGNNPPPPHPWSLDDYVSWVEKYAQFTEPFFLFGHSFGGSIATKFVIKNPEKIKKLFLIDTAGIRRKSRKKNLIKKTAHFAKKLSFLPFFNFFRKVFYRFIVKSDYPYTQGNVMRNIYLNIINEDISKDFSKITVPTIIIWGKKDKITPLKDAYYFKEQIRDARLEILPDIYHNPHRENPKLLVEKILTYL